MPGFLVNALLMAVVIGLIAAGMALWPRVKRRLDRRARRRHLRRVFGFDASPRALRSGPPEHIAALAARVRQVGLIRTPSLSAPPISGCDTGTPDRSSPRAQRSTLFVVLLDGALVDLAIAEAGDEGEDEDEYEGSLPEDAAWLAGRLGLPLEEG